MNGKGSPIYTNMSPVMSKFLWNAPKEKVDPQKAKQILEEKKLLPMEFTLKVPNSSKIYLDTAQSIKEQLNDIEMAAFFSKEQVKEFANSSKNLHDLGH